MKSDKKPAKKPAPKKKAAPKKAAPEPIAVDSRAERKSFDELLEDWSAAAGTTHSAAATEEVVEESLQLVTLMLGDEEYGLPIMQVQEINRMRNVTITRIPNTPGFVEGVVNLRGRLIPVVDVRKRFSLGTSEITRSSRVVVINVGGRTLGIIADAVVEVVRVLPSEMESLPDLAAGVDSEFIVGIFRIDDRLVILLDTDGMFTPEEHASIDQMPTAEENEVQA